jgi:hypothetical protein
MPDRQFIATTLNSEGLMIHISPDRQTCRKILLEEFLRQYLPNLGKL